MSKLDVTDRLAFLAEQFNVFESEKIVGTDDAIKNLGYNGFIPGDSVGELIKGMVTEKRTEELNLDGWEAQEIGGKMDNVIAIIGMKTNDKGRNIYSINVSYEVFTAIVGADPTPNKICVQWMLNVFSRELKDGNWQGARRFVFEDLPQAKQYIILFEANKRKKRFKDMAAFSLKGFKNVTDINEYRNLSQLYDAVDPFIYRDDSIIEREMEKYIELGEAEIPFKDRRYTIYIPKTTDAAVIFANFASWCTARVGNSNFDSYIRQQRPDGSRSELYVIIDNGFFTGKNKNIYQIHFESGGRSGGQIMNRRNSSNFDFYEEVLENSEGVRNYFGDKLMELAKEFKGKDENNYYIDILIKFGFTEVLFDMMDEKTTIIQIDKAMNVNNRKVPKLVDMSRFSELDTLVIAEASLHELHPSLGKLNKLKMISFFGNKISELPTEIGNLSNLMFLNLVGNPITVIPDSIKYLDKSNGGKLHRMSINKKDISEANYLKLTKLLPTALFH